ncbi:succinate dehydrogenase cytochrome b subunit [Actinokineospora sp. UTMC 2448]|uniref:succinate dehydrogenase cytochrome b subunit n=1 Tax=Actinokineospora sp. UTMC 2448 TaxID=2268449 RepID=UPI0021643770|nr:succinate dehydrogenase cytochrome b subunit [Actinokineospora sp. UTMC 2448]UVS81255.1 succinate dehydrogenase (or fumarate reductase) cytochrome b subunit, b558 family [Actinokineospora sp. UTMC 2448]
MAVTGIVLLAYVLVHMAANLKAFAGQESIDGYGHFLREFLEPVFGYGGFVWIVRVVLLAAVVLHIAAAVSLTRQARKARPIPYAVKQGGYAARTMRWGGVIIALFVVYHILDLTAGVLNPHGVPGEIHASVVAGFSRWYVVAFYTLAVVSLGFHIRHGMWSALRSLGARTAAQPAALAVAVAITVGFLSVPYAVLLGVIR